MNRTGSYPLRDLEPLDFKKALETFQKQYSGSLAETMNAELDAEFHEVIGPVVEEKTAASVGRIGGVGR
jgi:hypothetical protein